MKKNTMKKSTRLRKSGSSVGMKKRNKNNGRKGGGFLRTKRPALYIDMNNVVMYHCPLSPEQQLAELRKLQRKEALRTRNKSF